MSGFATLEGETPMIAGFEEAYLVALFLDFPAYVGDPQAGE